MRPFVTAHAALSAFVSISVLFAPMCLADADDHDVVEDHVRAKRELSEADETRFEALVKDGARASDEGRLNAAVKAYLKALRIRRDPLISGRVGRILATVDNAPTQVVAANNLYKAITEHAGVSLAERKGFFEAFDLLQSKICRISLTTKDVAVVQLDDNDPHKGYGSFWQFAEPGKPLHYICRWSEHASALFPTCCSVQQAQVSWVPLCNGGLAIRKDSAAETILQQTKSGNITQKQLDEYNMTLTSRDVLRTSSRATASGASALCVAGAIMYFFDVQRTSDETSPNRESVAISFTLTPSIAGIGINGRF